MDSADALCEAMADDDGDIRWAATNLMVQLGRENLAEIGARLLELAAGGDRNARKMALYCIRDLEIGGAELLAVVERAVHDSDVHVRLAALSVLSRLRDESGQAVRIMLECMKDRYRCGRAARGSVGARQYSWRKRGRDGGARVGGGRFRRRVARACGARRARSPK